MFLHPNIYGALQSRIIYLLLSLVVMRHSFSMYAFDDSMYKPTNKTVLLLKNNIQLNCRFPVILIKTSGSKEPVSLTWYFCLQSIHEIMQPLYFCFCFRDKHSKLHFLPMFYAWLSQPWLAGGVIEHIF